MTIPTRWAVLALMPGLLLCAMAAVDARWVVAAAAADAAVLLAIFVQGKVLARRRIVVRRRWQGQLQIDRPAVLQWEVENAQGRAADVTLRQHWPAGWDGPAGPWHVSLAPHERVVIEATATPRRRGNASLPPLVMDVTQRPSLAVHRREVDDALEAVVYPNLSAIRAYEQLRRSRALRAAGFHRQRLVGAGREFDHLREYMEGDDYRDINWAATARAGRPRTNLYQAERSRDVILCIDGGRMMGNPIGKHTTLDYAIDAAMLLAHACRDQSDRVGLVTFRDRVQTIIRPATTNHTLILKTLASFDDRPVFPNYLSLVETLRSRQTHRSLIFLMTDLSDPQLARDLVELLPVLGGRHVVVVVAMRDMLIERVADGPAMKDQLGRVLAARTLVRERQEYERQLQHAGIGVLHCDAQQLSLELVNRYMSIKARQLL